MGAGITTDLGLAPLDVFGFRIANVDSRALTKAATALLSGTAVEVVDGKLEISHVPVSGGGAWELRVRVPRAKYRLRIVVRPLNSAEIRQLPDPDGRDPKPAPNQWFQPAIPKSADESMLWELFNCEIVEVALEANQ